MGMGGGGGGNNNADSECDSPLTQNHTNLMENSRENSNIPTIFKKNFNC